MKIKRGVFVDHSMVHRWALRILPVLALVFLRCKCPVFGNWRMGETGGQRKYLYRAVDRDGTQWTFCFAPIETTLRPVDSSSGDRLARPAREDHRRQGRSEHGCHRERSSRQRLEHRIAPAQISEQHRRAGSSRRQTYHATDAGVQELSVHAHPDRGRRDDAHDPQAGLLEHPKGQVASAPRRFYLLAF